MQYKWESQQSSAYTIKEDNTEPLESSGTRIVLHLKGDSEEYLDDFKVRPHCRVSLSVCLLLLCLLLMLMLLFAALVGGTRSMYLISGYVRISSKIVGVFFSVPGSICGGRKYVYIYGI